MSEFYIRTPDHEDSRGPFDVEKLATLADAKQIDQETLYYDDDKEEWMPIGANPELAAGVFPQRGKLSLKPQNSTPLTIPVKKADEVPKEEAVKVEEILAAADGETEETAHLTKGTKSFEKAAALGTNGIGLMMLFSGFWLIFPQFQLVLLAYEEKTPSMLVNYPFMMVGFFDLMMALFLFLAATEVYPLLRGRGMLTTGFCAYLGWAIGDPILIGVATAAGVGMLYATITRRYSTMILSMALGIGGHGYLAYLAYIGYFTGFFDTVHFDFITVE